MAFSTSGDYERFYIVEGKRYHHIIDPRTCYPASNSRSVDAEFLTKATFILGGRKALDFAERWGAAAILVTQDNQVMISNSLKRKVEYWSPTP
jgi:thiamine biosynthesis lipoprotein